MIFKLHPKYTRILLHLAFWILVYFFFIVFYGRSSNDYGITVIFVSLLLPLSIATTYFLNYFLIPRYLLTRRYGRFFLFVFYTFVVSIWLEVFISLLIFILITNYQAYRMNPSSFDGLLLMVGLYFIIIIAVAIKQIRRSFQMQTQNIKLYKQRSQMELKLKEAELKLLKAQIHPHFLFNTLNNLYGLTLEKSDEAPQLVLRLSEILDYILYRCNEQKVLLSDEINNLENYLEIEKIRYTGKAKITREFPGNSGTLKIAPLLFIPLFENAFKHGVSQATEGAYVSARIILNGNILRCTIQNSKSRSINSSFEESGGIGLKNVKKRLELVYPGKYVLEINDNIDSFLVNLIMELEEQV